MAAPGTHLPVGPSAGLLQGCDEAGPILVVAHDLLPPVAPAQDMVDRPGRLDPNARAMPSPQPDRGQVVSIISYDPLVRLH